MFMQLSKFKTLFMENSFWVSFIFILLIVLVLLTIFGIVYIYVTSKNKERLALIEKGMDPNLASNDFWLQVGIIGGGAALGLITDGFLNAGIGPLIAILFAGAGLVIYNLMRKNKARGKK
jgi:predicted MFS family arabinose efflux permease